MNDRIGFAVAVGTCVLALGVGGCTEGTGSAENTNANANTNANPPTPAPSAPSALTAAHEAYLRGDYVALGENVRDVLLDARATELAKQNAFELFDSAYRVKGGALPSKFVPPPGYSELQYAVRRFASPHGPYYQIRFAGVTRDASNLVGLTVRRLPNETLMDKVSGKGTFSVRHDPSARSRGLEEFVIDSERLNAPPADGVIALRLELIDGTIAEGFIIAHGLTITGAPEVSSPEPSASIVDLNPMVRWTPLSVSQHVPFERARTGIHVHRGDDGPSLWEYATTNANDPTEVRIGTTAAGSKTPLAPGSYWLDLSAVESRFFGPVEILRASRISRPFQVVRP